MVESLKTLNTFVTHICSEGRDVLLPSIVFYCNALVRFARMCIVFAVFLYYFLLNAR
jgi:hypothetical protein